MPHKNTDPYFLEDPPTSLAPPEWPPLSDPGYGPAGANLPPAPRRNSAPVPPQPAYSPPTPRPVPHHGLTPYPRSTPNHPSRPQLAPPRQYPLDVDYLPVQQPLQSPLARQSHNRYSGQYAGQESTRLRDRLSVKAVAIGMTALTAVVGGGAAIAEAPSSSISKDANSHVPEKIRINFAEALDVDTCDTTVSLKEVTDMYYELFGNKEQGSQSATELAASIKRNSSQLEQLRRQQNFIPLPDSFARLQADVQAIQTLPISEYKQVASDYFKQFGIETMFDWRAGHGLASNDEVDQKDLDQVAGPASDDSTDIRAKLVTTMEAFAMLPPALVSHLGSDGKQTVRVLAFGNIANDRIGGATLTDGRGIIVIDTDRRKDTSQADQHAYSLTVPGHEDFHALDAAAICGEVTRKAIDGRTAGEDPAFVSLADGFEYSRDAEDILNSGHTVIIDDKQFGTSGQIDRSDRLDAEAVTPREYGAESPNEAKAVLLGENVFDPRGIVGLLMHPERNKQILKEQTALLLARLAKVEPGAVDYIKAEFKMARLQAAIDTELERIADREGRSVGARRDDLKKLHDSIVAQINAPATRPTR